MKKLLFLFILFIFIMFPKSSLGVDEELGGLIFSAPNAYSVYQSGNYFVNGYASVYWEMSAPDLVQIKSTRLDILKLNSSNNYVKVSERTGTNGTLQLIGAGNYKFDGVMSGTNINGESKTYTGSVYPVYVEDTQAPQSPHNFSVSTNSNWNPFITWNSSGELDLLANTTNGFLVERRLYSTLSQTWTNWAQIATISGTINTFTDTEIQNATGSGQGIAEYRVRAKDCNGNISGYSTTGSIRYGTSAEKIKNQNLSYSYSLGQNYPNPFNPSTTIYYSLNKQSFVNFVVYDILGKVVAELVSEQQEEGIYSVNFNAFNLPSGIYIYIIKAGDFIETKKMQLIK